MSSRRKSDSSPGNCEHPWVRHRIIIKMAAVPILRHVILFRFRFLYLKTVGVLQLKNNGKQISDLDLLKKFLSLIFNKISRKDLLVFSSYYHSAAELAVYSKVLSITCTPEVWFGDTNSTPLNCVSSLQRDTRSGLCCSGAFCQLTVIERSSLRLFSP